ncbi:MAG: hypothetical protein VX877_01445 [Planctomycetota bacterium]|nr:hypothetical protein [Planctomycetota bacterium]
MAAWTTRYRFHLSNLLSAVLVVVCVTAGVAAPPVETASTGVLVLRNGRVVAGQIQLVEEGYQVDSVTGRVVIPRNVVELEAENLGDAYRKLRAKMPDRSASRHIVLARWCLSYGLNQQALFEFREAERLAPKNSTARSMVARLEPITRPRGTVPTVRMASAVMSRDAEPVEFLGGLPRDVAAAFVQKIQPLLSHRCGNGSCHGPSTSRSFKLEPIGRDRSGFGVRTRKNLDAVLAEIASVKGSGSRLLGFARQTHGSAGTKSRSRGLNRSQLAILEKWVQRVAGVRPLPAKRRLEQKKAASTSRLYKGKAFRPVEPSGPRVDVFDPTEFNRETRRRETVRKQAAAAELQNAKSSRTGR